MATWFQGTGDEFIEANKAGWARGVSILHFLGGTSIDIVGERAVAQTKMTISQRDYVEGVLCDVVCTGRFYDFLERRSDRWGLVLRQPIYEKDRLDPVNPAAVLQLDTGLLNRFPEGYRHLAYLQTRIGYTVKPDMPGSRARRSKPYIDGGHHGWLAARRHPKLAGLRMKSSPRRLQPGISRAFPVSIEPKRTLNS